MYLGLDTPWGRWQMDEVTLRAGREAERNLQERQSSGSAVGKGKTLGYKSAAQGKNLRRVKINPNGTW